MPPSIGVNLRVTGHCSQGGRKYMEDLFSVAYQQTEDERDLEYAFFGIYDGHGGGEAAAFAKEHLMDSIVKQRQFWSDNDEDVLKAIRNGYMLTHLNMWKELEKWPKTVTGLPSTAGTTASVAFIRRGKIYIGHVGDSAIVLGYQKEGSEEWAAKPLTSDHKPEATIEIERIQKCGGKVITKAGVPRVVWNRPRMGHKGPIKKNTPMDEIPFLAVARSLGDLWSYNPQNDEFIVSPDPDVGVLTIDPSKFRCLIFGTDGLWNMISAEGAVSLVQATERHNEAALVGGNANQPRDWLNPSKSLVDHALERWSNTRMRADNTSVVTLMLDPPGPPRATVLRSRTGTSHRNHVPQPAAAPPAHAPGQAPGAAPGPPPARLPPHAEVRSGVPQNGLTIMTRYSDVDRPAAAPGAAERTPLPPCATLDGRFSAPGREDTPREEEEAEEDAMKNYGNPAESYFMAKLLSRSRVINTLSEVYDEIVNGRKTRVDAEASETSAVTATTVATIATIAVPAAGDAARSPSPAGGPAPAPERRADAAGDAPPAGAPDPDGGIQINEVSSSSPTDAPRPRARRPRPEGKRDAVANDRVLRSHPHHEPDAASRPHTRQSRGRNPDRVVILSRRPPARPERPERSPAEARRAAPECGEEDARRTRSQLASPGNCARAPGPARRAGAARGAHCKENLCAGGVGGGSRTRAPRPAPPAPRPRARRAASDEVHSTTGWARALRSRNDAAQPQPAGRAPPHAAAPPAKRARCEARAAGAAGGGAGAGARAPWPALALRHRLRRRLAK